MNRPRARLTRLSLTSNSPTVGGSNGRSRVHGAGRLIRPLALMLAFTGAAAVPAATSSGAATALGGMHLASQQTALSQSAPMSITNVRTGRHATYDRLVIDLSARGRPSYSVHYVRVVSTQGRGEPVPLRGGAKLEIVLMVPDININTGKQTYHFANRKELTNVTGFSAFRQVAYGGSFEGYTTIGLGVRTRLPVHTSFLNGPGAGSRVVIDVAHH